MAIIQSYRGNAKKVNLRVKRTMPIDEEEIKKRKKRAEEKSKTRKVKLSGKKKPTNITVRVKRYEAKQQDS